MADIQTYLDYILSKVYGKDVRQAIVDAINQCYTDATAGITPVITTEQIAGGTRFIVTIGSVSTSFDVMNGISPQVATAITASEMTDTDLIYIYTGSETGYANGDWYYYDGSEWQDGGQYQSTAPAIDATLFYSGQAADAKATGDKIKELNNGVNSVYEICKDSAELEAIAVSASSNGYRLNESNGLCYSDSSYKLVKYKVTAGTLVNVTSNDRFQFQSVAEVPSGGTSNRIGKTYSEGDYYLRVPANATYLIFSTPINNSVASANYATELHDEVEKNLINPVFYNGVTNNHIPDYSTAANSRQWLITDEIMKVKKGSFINCIGNTMYVIIESYDDTGAWVERLHAGNLSSNYTFTNDANIRICIRATDYSFVIPSMASSNYKFKLLNRDERTEKEAKISFIGIGAGQGYSSGQAQLVQLPNGKNLLIDSHLLTSYTAFYYKLRDRGVRHIDYYVQSHYHSDHIGLINLMTQSTMTGNIDITGMVAFLPQEISTSSLSHITGDTPQTLVDRQTALIDILNDNSCTIIRPTDGQKVDLGDGISLEFYNTDHSVFSDSSSTYYSQNYNDWSLCCYLNFGLNSINFSADLGPIGQRKVGGTLRKANILTAPHHGWDNGANNLIPAFINNVNPDTVISVNGWEHHPDNESSPANMMLATSPMQSYCEANGVSNYPTCTNGTIDILMNRYGWKFSGKYSRYIRNGKNWKYSDNTDKQE